MDSQPLVDVEASIRSIWRELLEVDDIQPDQSFFEVGGDSLSMIEMLFQLNQRLGIDVDPALLFQAPTLRGFAKSVELIERP